jgi:hypothetical protein
MDLVSAAHVALSLVAATAGVYAAACARAAARDAQGAPQRHAATSSMLGRVLQSLVRVHGSLDILAELLLARRRELNEAPRSEEVPPSSSRRLK